MGRLNRRAFVASLFAPLFAHLALPAAPERKLLKPPLKTGTMSEQRRGGGDGLTIVGTLQMSGDGGKTWQDCGTAEVVVTKPVTVLDFGLVMGHPSALYRANVRDFGEHSRSITASICF